MPDSPKQISGSITACTSFCDPSPEAGIHVNSGAPTICEPAQEVSILQKVDDTSVSVDSNVHITKSDRDLIALNSAQLELKGMESINGLTDFLGLMKEEAVVEKEEDPPILENVPKNGHVIFKADVQVISNETVEESAGVGMDMEIAVPNTVTDDGLLLSSPSGVESEKTNGEVHIAGASRSSMDDVSASEVQIIPLSLDSHTAQACQAMTESVIADRVTRGETTDEAGVDDENGSREVDELQMEKADAAKALELKMVELIMQSPGFEVTESRNDGTMNSLSDDPLTVREQEDGNGGKDTMIGLSDEDKFADLFEPVVQLPEHPEGINGFLPGTLDSECLSNGQVLDDLHIQQERHASKTILHSQDPHSAHVAPNKDLEFPEVSGSDKGNNSMDRQYSEVVTPSAATSAQSQSSVLKVGVLLLTMCHALVVLS